MAMPKNNRWRIFSTTVAARLRSHFVNDRAQSHSHIFSPRRLPQSGLARTVGMSGFIVDIATAAYCGDGIVHPPPTQFTGYAKVERFCSVAPVESDLGSYVFRVDFWCSGAKYAIWDFTTQADIPPAPNSTRRATGRSSRA